MRRLEEREVGYPTPAGRVPIVPAAVLYDLAVGSAAARPDSAAGYAACVAAEAGDPCGWGPVGAGTGATVGKLLGPGTAAPGGLGSASRTLPGGGTVAALAVVNAVGDVVAEDGSVLAGPGTVTRVSAEGMAWPPPPGTSTTLVVVGTDLALTKTQAHRLATVAHDGLAHAIRPVHTAYDGDTVFALSTGSGPVTEPQLLVLQVLAVEVVASAIRAAVTV
jgi:L-aminopeptidase/D-esterase-like protein